MIELTQDARRRLIQLRDAAGHSSYYVHTQTGISLPWLYGKAFSESEGLFRVQADVFSRLIDFYRGELPREAVARWVLRGDPSGCPLQSPDPADGAEPGNEAEPAPAAAPRTSRLRTRLALVVVVGLVGLAAVGLRTARDRYSRLEISGSTVAVRAPILGTLWEAEHDSKVECRLQADWNGRRVVAYGLSGPTQDSGTLLVRDFLSGDVLWTSGPLYDEVADLYGTEMAAAGSFRCDRLHVADLQGDGAPELIAQFSHQTYFPNHFVAYQSDGSVAHAYHNWGSAYGHLMVDIDADGKDELVLGGTNNARHYQGATITLLDDACFSGAAIDSSVRFPTSWCDSSRARVVFPQWDQEFMDALEARRLQVLGLHHLVTDQGWFLEASVGVPDYGVVVVCDENLVPLRVTPGDALMTRLRSISPGLEQRFRERLPAWLERRRLFGTVHAHPLDRGRAE